MKIYREPLSISSSYLEEKAHTSLWSRFINWTISQEKNRFLWLAVSLVGHGCVITILTLFAIIFSGNHTILWPFAMGGMVACLVVNLSAMPTKITIPVFLLSVLVDLVIIATCIVNGINLNSIY
jgi:hypothetical protein